MFSFLQPSQVKQAFGKYGRKLECVAAKGRSAHVASTGVPFLLHISANGERDRALVEGTRVKLTSDAVNPYNMKSHESHTMTHINNLGSVVSQLRAGSGAALLEGAQASTRSAIALK